MSESTKLPEAEGVDIVLIGAFNPAIFHPEWFLRQGIITEQDAKAAQVVEISEQFSVIQLCGFQIQCVSNRLIVGTMNVSVQARMQDLLALTLAQLSHTPVTACGINPTVQYRVSSVEHWHKIGHSLAPKELVWKTLLPDPGLHSLSILASRPGKFAGTTSISVGPSKDFNPGIYIKVNYHFDLPLATLHDGAAALASDFMQKEMETACKLARTTGEKIFTEIKPD